MAASSKRARAMARARYERAQQRQTARATQRRRRASTVAAVSSVLVVVLLVWGVAVLVGGPDSPAEATPAASGTTSATSGTSGTSTASTAAFSCPAPATTAPSPTSFASEPPITLDPGTSYRATITTNCGPIVVDLLADQAPHAVNSFLFLAGHGYYDNTRCHRLTTAADGLSVLQCGDPTGTGSGGPGYQFGVENPPADGVYPAGTLAMARTADPDSNGSQFFITYADSTIPSPDGYTVFGKVVSGLDIVEKIGKAGKGEGTAPKVAVALQSIEVVTSPKGTSS